MNQGFAKRYYPFHRVIGKIITFIVAAIILWLLYAGATYCYLSANLHKSSALDLQFLDLVFGFRTESSGYLASQISSFRDNSIFFLFIGAALTFYSLIRPEDSSFSQKIAYLFPRVSSSPAAARFLERQINRHAIISPHVRATLQINELDQENKLANVTTIFESKLSNLHNKHVFIDDEMNFTFTASPETLKALRTKLGKNDDEDIVWGSVLKIRTMHEGDSDHWRWHTKGCHLLHSGQKVAKRFYLKGMYIRPDGEAQLDCVASTWTASDGKTYDFFGVHRFTERLEMYFVNNTSHKIKIEYARISRKEHSSYCPKYWQDKTDFWKNSEELGCAPVAGEVYGQDNRHHVIFEDFSVDDYIIWRVSLA